MPATGTLDKKYVSALTLMDVREIDGRIIDASGEIGFLDYMKWFGRTLATKQAWFYQHVNEDLIKVGDTTGQTVSDSGTPTVTATLTAATSGFWREGDIVKLRNKNARIVSLSTASSKDTLVLYSVDGSNLTLVAGNPIVWSSNALAEANGARNSINNSVNAYYNHIQIIGESHKSTDISQLTFVEAPSGKTFYVREYQNTVLRLKKAIGGMLIGGQISATRFSDSSPAMTGTNGYGVQTAMGLDQYATTYGGTRSLTTAGTVTLTDMDTREDALLAKKSPKKFIVTGSTRAFRPYDNFLKNLNSSGLESVRMNIDGMDVNLTVKKYMRTGGFEYEFLPCQTFDDPTMYPVNTNATDIGKSLYYLPKDKVNIEGGGTAERFRVRFLDANANLKMSGPNTKWSDLIVETYTGGLAPSPTSPTRTQETEWTSYQALECLGAQHFYKEVITAT